jgi:hypothetical protein
MDEGQASTFLHLIGCRKINYGAEWVRSTCPLEHRHSGGFDNKPSFAISIRPNDSSGCRCLGCGYATEQLIYLLWKLSIERGMDTDRAVQFLLKNNQIGLAWLERTVDRPPAETDLMGRVSHSRTYVSSYERQSTFVHPDDAPQAEVPEEVLQKMIADLPEAVLTYLKTERRLDPLTIAEWELGWHAMKGRICIPIRNEEGKLIAVSGRKFDEQAWGPKYLHSRFKRDRVLYGEHRVNKAIRKGYLLEGFFQVIRLAQHGYVNPLARMGTHLSKQQAAKLVEWFDHLVIVPDGDKAGMDSAMLIREQLKDQIETIEIPDMPKGKDADSLSPKRLPEIVPK